MRVELDPGRARGGRRRRARGDGDDRAAGRPDRRGSRSGCRCRGSARIRSRRGFRSNGRASISAPCSLATGDVLPLPPLSLPVLAGVRAARRSRGGPGHAARDGPHHRRRRAHGVGRRVHAAPAARPAGARSRRTSARAILLAVHVLEIAGRRLLLFAAVSGRLRAIRIPKPGLAWIRRSPAVAPEPRGPDEGQSPPAPPPAPSKPVTSPLARAKAKARGRLER